MLHDVRAWFAAQLTAAEACLAFLDANLRSLEIGADVASARGDTDGARDLSAQIAEAQGARVEIFAHIAQLRVQLGLVKAEQLQ